MPTLYGFCVNIMLSSLTAPLTGIRADDLTKERKYFIRNSEHKMYHRLRPDKFPIKEFNSLLFIGFLLCLQRANIVCL